MVTYKHANCSDLISILVGTSSLPFQTGSLCSSLRKRLPSQQLCQHAPDACQPAKEPQYYSGPKKKKKKLKHNTALSSPSSSMVHSYSADPDTTNTNTNKWFQLSFVFCFFLLPGLLRQTACRWQGLLSSSAIILDHEGHLKTSSASISVCLRGNAHSSPEHWFTGAMAQLFDRPKTDMDNW